MLIRRYLGVSNDSVTGTDGGSWLDTSPITVPDGEAALTSCFEALVAQVRWEGLPVQGIRRFAKDGQSGYSCITAYFDKEGQEVSSGEMGEDGGYSFVYVTYQVIEA